MVYGGGGHLIFAITLNLRPPSALKPPLPPLPPNPIHMPKLKVWKNALKINLQCQLVLNLSLTTKHYKFHTLMIYKGSVRLQSSDSILSTIYLWSLFTHICAIPLTPTAASSRSILQTPIYDRLLN